MGAPASNPATTVKGQPTRQSSEDPMKSILDRSFRYTPSFETDLRKTFARIERERRLAGQRDAPAGGPPLASVSSIVRKSADLKQ
jgi:hypothetical protein